MTDGELPERVALIDEISELEARARRAKEQLKREDGESAEETLSDLEERVAEVTTELEDYNNE